MKFSPPPINFLPRADNNWLPEIDRQQKKIAAPFETTTAHSLLFDIVIDHQNQTAIVRRHFTERLSNIFDERRFNFINRQQFGSMNETFNHRT